MKLNRNFFGKNLLKLSLAAICSVVLGFNDVQAESKKVEIEIEKPHNRVIQVRRGRRPVVTQRPEKITVQTKPKYQNVEGGKASSPADDRGLQLTIQPEKKSFNVKEPLAFTVTLKNTSQKNIMLHGGELLGLSPKLVVANMKSAAQWTIQGDFSKSKEIKSIVLKPGEEIQRTLVATPATQQIGKPVRIMPFGGIRPNIKGRPIQIKINGMKIKLKNAIPQKQPAPKRAKPVRIRRLLPNKAKAVQPKNAEKSNKEQARIQQLAPRIAICGVVGVMPPASALGFTLPCGKGECRARLFLEFKESPNKKKLAAPYWAGKIVSQPVDFEVAEYAVIIDHRKKKQK